MLIRLATPAAAAAVAAISAPCVTETAACFELAAPDHARMARRMRDAGERSPWIVAQMEGEVVGYRYGTRYRTEVGLAAVHRSLQLPAVCQSRVADWWGKQISRPGMSPGG